MLKLTKRQKYDYRDTEWVELKLIRVGQYIWSLYRREKPENGGYPAESGPLWEALETVWRLKQEYRAALKLRLAEQSARMRERFHAKP